MTEYSDKSKIIIILLVLWMSFFTSQILFDSVSFTGMVIGLPHENAWEDEVVCWGNASFDCSECSGEDCTDYGCTYAAEVCSGEPAGSCADYPDGKQCGHVGCEWDGEEEICGGELLCSHFGGGEGCSGVEGCSWQEADCSDEADCLNIVGNTFCGLASGCTWMESDCGDDEDNDEDEQTDCADSDCDGYFKFNKFYCEYNEEISCDDNYDNDGDGDIDGADSDCLNTAPNTPSILLNSSSGEYRDSDNLTLSIISGGDPDDNIITNITDFRINNQSIAILNLPFDLDSSENIRDYTSYDNEITFDFNPSEWNSSGICGGSYTFDGTDQRVTTNMNSIKNLRNMTMSFWIYPTAWQKGVFTIANSNNYRWYFMVGNPDNSIRILSRYAGANYDLVVNEAIPNLNNWYYITVTLSEQEGTNLYIDGSLAGTKSNAIYSFNDISDTKNAYIGAAYYSGFSDFYNGNLDEFKIYNRILSEDQIQIEYDQGIQGIHSRILSHNETTLGENWTVAVTASDSNLESQTVLSNQITITNPEIPIHSLFDGATTDFQNELDLGDVDDLKLDIITQGSIEWNDGGLDVSYLDFDSNIQIGKDYINVDIPNLNSDINSSANITLINISYFGATPIILMDGLYCDDCVLNSYDGENISFTVQHFTNYSLGVNSELLIYDEFEFDSVHNGTNISFFANYTNRTSGNHIAGAVCNISFDDGSSALMENNGLNYNYTKINGFVSSGYYVWNVTCNHMDYEELMVQDNIFINPQLSNFNCSNVTIGNWNKTFGGVGKDDSTSIIQTYDCGFVIAGFTESYGAGKNDTWIIKINSSGDHQWNKTFGGTDNDYIYDVIETSESSLVFVGSTESYGVGNYDAWIIETEYNGLMRWNKTFGRLEDDEIYTLDQTSDNGYILGGYSKSYDGIDKDLWMIKLDILGNHQWNKTYNGTDDDAAKDIIETNDLGFIAVGYTNTTFSNPLDYWMIKVNQNGVLVFENSPYNSPEWHNYNDWFESIIELDDGTLVISANQYSLNAYGGNSFVYDASGNSLDLDSYEDKNYYNDIFTSSALMHDGGYIFTGYSNSLNYSNYNFWVIQTNSTGEQQHERVIGGSSNDYGRDMVVAEDNSYVITGYTESYGNRNDLLIISSKLEICSNSIDDDGDGYIDCEDSDCQGYNHSSGWGCYNNDTVEINCEDTNKGIGIDNDNDGFANCEDSDCTFGCTYDCVGVTNITCADLSIRECGLYGCVLSSGGPMGGPYSYTGCVESSGFGITQSCSDVEGPSYCLSENNCTLDELSCQNNIDDDGDSLIDCADDYCSTHDSCVECMGDAVFNCDDLSGDNCTGFGCTSTDMCFGFSSYDSCDDLTDPSVCTAVGCRWAGSCRGDFINCSNANVYTGMEEYYCNQANCNWDSVCSGEENCNDVEGDFYCNLASGCSWTEMDCDDSLDNDLDSFVDLIDPDCQSISPNDQSSGKRNTCSENWDCTKWSDCFSNDMKYRECIDSNECDSNEFMPDVEQECEFDLNRMIKLKCSQLLDGQDFNLVLNDVGLSILMPDFIYHVAKIREVNKDNVVIDVASRIQRRVFERGDVEFFDVDVDGIDDLEIALLKIYSPTHATVNVKCLNPEPEDINMELVKEDYEVQARYVNKNLFGMAIMNKVKSDWLTWLFYLIVLAGITYFIIKKIKFK